MGPAGDGPEGSREPLFIRLGKYAAIGVEFPSTVIGGLFLGYLLDTYLASFPWLTAICTLVALVGAFLRLVQWLQRLSKENR